MHQGPRIMAAREASTEIMGENSWQFSPDSYSDSFFKASFHRPRMSSIVFDEENLQPLCNSTVGPLSADVFRPSAVPVLDKTEIRLSSLTMMLNNASSFSSTIHAPHLPPPGSGPGTWPESPRTITEVPPSALRKTTDKVAHQSLETKWDKFRTTPSDTDSDSDCDSGDESSDDASSPSTGDCHPSVFAFLHDQYMRSRVKKVACLNFDMKSQSTTIQLRRLHEKAKKKEKKMSLVRFTIGDAVTSTTSSSVRHSAGQLQIPIGGSDEHPPTAAAEDSTYFMMSL